VNVRLQESRADFIAGKVDRHPGRSHGLPTSHSRHTQILSEPRLRGPDDQDLTVIANRRQQ
jgi:hypothetical protein